MPNVGAIALDHIGFTVASLNDAVRFWTDAMGFKLLGDAELTGAFIVQTTAVEASSLRAAVVEAPNGSRVELLEYSDDQPKARVSRSAAAVGAAHVAVSVADIEQAVARIEAEGWAAKGTIGLIPSGRRQGTRVAHMSGPDGVVVELMQVAD